MSAGNMTIHLQIWRQKNKDSRGRMEDYTLEGVSPDMSFLEMLDLHAQKSYFLLINVGLFIL